MPNNLVHSINGTRVSERELYRRTQENKKTISLLKPGDLVKIEAPDSWNLGSVNGGVFSIKAITSCNLCDDDRLSEGSMCPGNIILDIPTHKHRNYRYNQCWGYGGVDQLFALTPVLNKKVLVFRKEG